MTITVGDGTVPEFAAGTIGASIPVYISSNESGTRLLGGFTLAFDFDLPGKGLNTSSLSNFVGIFAPGVFNSSDFAEDPFADNFDFQAGGIFTAGNEALIDAANGQTELFKIGFDISLTAAPGDYDLIFRPDATQFSFGINGLVDGTGVSTLALQASEGRFV